MKYSESDPSTLKLRRTSRQKLLKLARKALEYIFKTREEYSPKKGDMREEFKVKKATFVTLTINDELRGCMGKLQAVQELYKDVIENTYSAAFSDPRFPQLQEEELKKIKIEISILSKAKALKYKDSKELAKKIMKKKPGVILSKDFLRATYLPQVWEDFETAEEFLASLCEKAGLPSDEWTYGKLEIQTYNVVKFREYN